LPDKLITDLIFEKIPYECGSTLKLTDIFLAWTDAAKPYDKNDIYDPTHKNSCPTITTKLDSKGKLDITPKCGTLDEIVIETPLDVTVDHATICEGQSVTLTANATGGGGEYSYLWSPGGEETESITVSPVVDTKYTGTVYAESVFDSNEICDAEFEALVTVNNVTPGVIAGSQTLCSTFDPAAFTSTTSGSGGGTISYQWQISTTSAVAGFTDIGGATLATYDAPAVAVQTWFRRVATSTLNSVLCPANSNVLTVSPNAIDPGVIAGSQTLC
jgi:hypothetical protein